MNCSRLCDDAPHLIERLHIEGDEYAVRGTQPHIVPFSDRRARRGVRQAGGMPRREADRMQL